MQTFFFIEGINHQAGVKSKQGTTVVNNIDQYNMQQIAISDKTTFPTSTSLLQIKKMGTNRHNQQRCGQDVHVSYLETQLYTYISCS